MSLRTHSLNRIVGSLWNQKPNRHVVVTSTIVNTLSNTHTTPQIADENKKGKIFK